MTCTIIGVIVSCLVTSKPAPNPDAAFRIFAQSARPVQIVPVYPLGLREPIPPNPRGASLGPWDFPTPSPRTRLDGSLLSDPVTVYGGYPTWFMNVYPPPGSFVPNFYPAPPRTPGHHRGGERK